MSEKTYKQMKSDFKNFYFNEVKPYLPDYEKKRKEGVPKIKTFQFIWFTFLPGFLLIFLSMPFLMNSASVARITLCLGILFIVLAIGGFVYLSFLTKNDPRISPGTVEIQQDFEMKLKEKLMTSFLKIFSDNASWRIGLSGGYQEKIKTFRESRIFNTFPFAIFEDVFSIEYRNVNIGIFEVNTSVFNKISLYAIPFFIVFFLCLFNIFLPIILIIITVIFFKKIYGYAGFRGVVIELNMNKNFKGHTFFKEISFTAKRIFFDHKKYEPVNLESADFSKNYKVYSTDQIEARYVLTTSMVERLDALSKLFEAKFIRGSFKDNKLILAINTNKDMFAMGNDFIETNFETFQTLFNEIISTMEIIDILKLNEKTGL